MATSLMDIPPEVVSITTLTTEQYLIIWYSNYKEKQVCAVGRLQLKYSKA